MLKNKLVISIQEHISYSRDDGRRQTPNIFDDEKSLKCIFNHLKNKNVWYCTGNELAKYIKVTKNIKITVCDKGFEITTKIDFDYNESLNITIKIENYSKFKEVISPNGNKIEINEEFINIPFQVGRYIFR